jgi:ferredoxin
MSDRRNVLRRKKLFVVFPALLGISAAPLAALAHECPPGLPDEPVITNHVEQSDIVSGALTFDEISDHGEALFVAPFNVCDGQGRPATTGGGEKRVPEHQYAASGMGPLETAGQLAKLRTSAPDSDSCAGCHAQPRPGGAGDFVANVFVLAQTLDPVTLSVGPESSNSRNTLGMNGSGPIEMLAREMTVDLQTQAVGLPDGDHTLTTKGVDFEVTIAGGAVVASRGVNTDLIIRPFHQAGAVVSLREFTDNAYNHHHGIQAEERFDLNPAKGMDPDFDEDGVQRELTVGDVTAVTLWQAQLGVPGRVVSKDKAERRMANRGEQVFDEVGCTSCHVPEMTLESRLFVEPNPFNPPGTCSEPSVCPEYAYDMTKQGEGPLLEKGRHGTAIVRAYTDLKRHNLCDDPTDVDPIRFFCNEQLPQGRPDQDGRPGSEFFLTRKLWDVGNSAPYGHRGDLSTISEAILAHGGEARASRDAFVGSPESDQVAVVKFLKTLQVVPEGRRRVIVQK